MEPKSELSIEYRKLFGETCIIVDDSHRESDEFDSFRQSFSGYVLYDEQILRIKHYTNGILKNPNGWSMITPYNVVWKLTYYDYYMLEYDREQSRLVLDEVDGFLFSGKPCIEVSEDHKRWVTFFDKTVKDFEEKLSYYKIKRETIYKVLTKDAIELHPILPGLKDVIEGKVNFEYVVKSIE